MAVMLDTCALLSLAGLASRRLSDDTLERLRLEDEAYVSAVSLFEIAIKHAKGALDLGPYTPGSLWETATVEYALTVLPVEAEEFLGSVELPPHHRDPSDRIIIAQAMRKEVDVITYDQMFDEYEVRTIS